MIFHLDLNKAQWPCQSMKGNKKSVATQTRVQAVAKGPNSAAPIRMNKNDEPHRAANIK
jgi:hypothetical protein